MSLLLSEGHPAARRYPLIVVWQEAQLVRERNRLRMAEEAVMLHTVITAQMAKGGHRQLEKLLKDLRNG